MVRRMRSVRLHIVPLTGLAAALLPLLHQYFADIDGNLRAWGQFTFAMLVFGACQQMLAVGRVRHRPNRATVALHDLHGQLVTNANPQDLRKLARQCDPFRWHGHVA